MKAKGLVIGKEPFMLLSPSNKMRGGEVGYLVTKVSVLFDISTAVDAAGGGLSVAEIFARNDPNLATLRPINCAPQWWVR